ncbi:MAG: hypothetical protein DWH85_01330 [Planctomycetota bacterium]|nr:MAG: hypothetical protein DWH85_01330 [Planctomycetota bacterium]
MYSVSAVPRQVGMSGFTNPALAANVTAPMANIDTEQIFMISFFLNLDLEQNKLLPQCNINYSAQEAIAVAQFVVKFNK